MVSMPLATAQILGPTIANVLQESGLTEFKWAKLRQARERFAAERLIGLAIDAACADHLRIDALIWDTEDSRHKIQGRDDNANLQRMFYHLARNVMCQRWPAGSVWRLCPDEHETIDWGTLEEFLARAGDPLEVQMALRGQGQMLTSRSHYKVRELTPVVSTHEPIVQIADLFAGLTVFSRTEFQAYKSWSTSDAGQLSLFDMGSSPVSKAAATRFPILASVNTMFKDRKLGIAFESTQGLRTKSPNSPINFWWYEPQRALDTAPRRALSR